MKNNLTAKLAKKIIAADKNTTSKVMKYGIGCLKCLESDPISVSKAIHKQVLEIIFNPTFIKSLNEEKSLLKVWKKILKLISKHFYNSNTKILQIVLEKNFNTLESVLSGKSTDDSSLKLLVFSLLATKSIKKRQILIDFSDLLFNTFKSIHLFLASCLLLKTLFLKVTLEDFDEVFLRIIPTFYPALIKILQESHSNFELMAALKLIEFFKLIVYDKFLPFEGVLMSVLQGRISELNNNHASLCSIELITLTSRSFQMEPAHFMVYFLSPERENVLSSIEHILSVYFQQPLEGFEFATQIKESIVLDLIRK